MPLNIIVLVKQVPDTNNITGDAMKDDGTINRAALPAIMNPEDLHALEAALQVRDKTGGTITAITLGPPGAVKVLKESLHRGADDAILVTDPKFAASDTLATSYALKCAIAKVGKYDLIFCGRQAIDGDTAQVGPQIAEKLNINQLTCLTKITEITNDNITIHRSIDGGYETIRSKFPVLVTVTDEANKPRFPMAKRVLMYKHLTCKSPASYNEAYMHVGSGELCSHIKQWSISDIAADTDCCGLSGSPTKVKKIENVVLTARDTKQIANAEADINSLMHELAAEHIIG